MTIHGLDSHSYVVIILFVALMYLVLRRKDPPGPDAVPT